MILGCVFSLLFAGIYLTLFVFPQVLENDPELIRQATQRAVFEDRFRDEFQAIVEDGYWAKLDVVLKAGERVGDEKSSADGKHIVIVGNEGTVWVTADYGQSWKMTQGDNQGNRLDFLVTTPPGNTNPVAVAVGTDNGEIYLLKTHPDMADWERWSLQEISDKIKENKLLRNSRIFEQVSDFLTNDIYSFNSTGDGKPRISTDNGFLGLDLSDLTVMRIVTLTVLFFLVQVLVRLYQYNLRLSAFWDSRGDAVYLAHSFAGKKSERFEDLVSALSPDEYDFKPAPKPITQKILDSRGPRNERTT